MLSELTRVAGLMAPPGCGACGESCESGKPLCRRCGRALRRLRPLLEPGPPGIDRCCAAGAYEGIVRRLVLAIKFQRRTGLAGSAAEVLVRAWPGPLGAEIVPVPADPLRWRWRGFDPAEELGLALAARTGLPLRQCLRRRAGRRQAGRSRSQRPLGVPMSGRPGRSRARPCSSTTCTPP